MAHPGEACTLPPEDQKAHVDAVVQCLCDHEVSLMVVPVCPDAQTLAEALCSLTKSASAPIEEADYLVVPAGDSGGAVLNAQRGDPLFPDRGATIIYCPDAEACEANRPAVRLSGPGIETTRSPELGGLTAAEYERLREANDDYPLGVDAFVLAPDGRVMGLPRSTQIETE
jgi:alpha-D-ribose 1-methylphosphonate 5-triphosphate synthase subunit PhnH